jgi:hypothetical protein
MIHFNIVHPPTSWSSIIVTAENLFWTYNIKGKLNLLWYNAVQSGETSDVSEEHIAFVFSVEEYAKQETSM